LQLPNSNTQFMRIFRDSLSPTWQVILEAPYLIHGHAVADAF
jgi:hypothetical protein